VILGLLAMIKVQYLFLSA